MKIDINKVNIVPKSISDKFKLCVYGKPNLEILEWIKFHQFQIEEKDNYTNINISLSNQNQLSNIFHFNTNHHFEFMDGFSPNLNKKLHIGHFSNLTLAKAFKSLGVCNNTVSIYGDTLKSETISKEEAIQLLTQYQNDFEFYTDKTFFASEMILDNNDNILKDGADKYIGTKIFEIANEKIVAIKSNRFETSYFYQDVVLAKLLNAPTLYLTGKEQSNHFKLLKQLFPHNINHIGLGLVKVSGVKMASRIGNVILIEDFIKDLNIIFDNNIQLIYNVFAGFILKSNPEVDKNINLDLITNPKNSSGLYISYTMARLISAGCNQHINIDNYYYFKSKHLEFAYIKAKYNLKPNILFEAILKHCKDINYLYGTHIIKDNETNKNMFDIKLSDLIHGVKLLGMFVIDKV